MDTNQLIIIAVVIVVALYLVAGNKKNTTKTKENIAAEENAKGIDKYPYEKKYLLTKTEYAFYSKLQAICNKMNYIICPKVRLEDFIKVTTKEELMKYRGYIKSRHVDFLICDNKLNIIMGIELDDNSHNKESAKKTDEFKNKLFETINIPLERVKVSSGDYEQQIVDILNKHTNNK